MILLLVLVFASVAAGSPLAKPPPSKPKPSQISTPEATILTEVTTTAVHPAPTFVPTAIQALVESQKPSSQKSPEASNRNPSNLSSQNSRKAFSDNSMEQFRQNSTIQLGQNYTKESGQNTTKEFDQNPNLTRLNDTAKRATKIRLRFG